MSEREFKKDDPFQLTENGTTCKGCPYVVGRPSNIKCEKFDKKPFDILLKGAACPKKL